MLLDKIFGQECFLNEIVWAVRLRRPAAAPVAGQARHDPRLREGPRAVLVRLGRGGARALHGARAGDPGEGGARQADRRLVAHHRLADGHEKTGYPTQKPEGIVRRMVGASAGAAVVPRSVRRERHGGAVAQARPPVMIDTSPASVEVMQARLENVPKAAETSRGAGSSLRFSRAAIGNDAPIGQ